MRNLLLVFLMVILSNSTALGAKTNWVDIGLGAKMRLISSDKLNSDSSVMIGLEMKMPKGVKTYWRIPGEAGIPLQLDIKSKENNMLHQIFWPFPLREEKYGYIDYVYYGNQVFPIKIKLDAKEQSQLIKVDIFLGICANICIPVKETLELKLDFKKLDRSQNSRLNLAMSLVPINWDKKEIPIKHAIINVKTSQLEILVDPDKLDPLSLIADYDELDVLFSLPHYSLTNSIVSFNLLDKNMISDMMDKPVRLTFQTSDGAYEVFLKTRIVNE